MINREIIYERNVSKSYMKIPACLENTFDEELMLKKEIPGCLQVEKCYINGAGQYWYNITGKQALDSYTKMKPLGSAFAERLLLSICMQMEKLEWNLLSPNCLVLDPEFIFVGTGNEDIFFILYPENKGEVHTELRKLTEYLLTKLDHKDTRAVKTLYAIYEVILTEGYSLEDIRQIIEKSKEESLSKEEISPIKEKEIPLKKIECVQKTEMVNKGEISEKREETISLKLQYLWKKALEILNKELFDREGDDKETWNRRLFKKDIEDSDIPMVTYPDKEEISYRMPSRPVVNPTVCLVSATGQAKGILMHMGTGDYPDYELSETRCEIGNHPEADLYIPKETVSCYHASIEYKEGSYYIEDLNSTNGTYVNEVPVNYKQREKLNSGDEIRFANIRYRFL